MSVEIDEGFYSRQLLVTVLTVKYSGVAANTETAKLPLPCL